MPSGMRLAFVRGYQISKEYIAFDLKGLTIYLLLSGVYPAF
jgi:hypothetical protein